MVNAWISVTIAALVLGCSGAMVGGDQGAELSAPEWDSEELALNIENSDLLFVGRSRRSDHSWYPFAGAIVPTRAPVRFQISHILKGEETAHELRVLVLMTGGSAYFEESERGVRLSTAFFKEDSEYIVLAKRMSFDPGEPASYHVVGIPEMGIWPATEENWSAIRKALDR